MTTRLFLAATLLVLSFATAHATDLTKVDRSNGKEPTYKTKPKYCLLVFGPEAKTRVWLVMDGDVLYVDRNGNGDLTEPGERIVKKKAEPYMGEPAGSFDVGTIAAAGGGQAAPKLSVIYATVRKGLDFVLDETRGSERLVSGSDGPVPFAEDQMKAPVLHFQGPLRLAVENRRILAGREQKLRVRLETPGLGEGGTTVKVAPCWVPKDLQPLVEMEFPNKNKQEPPVKLKMSLGRNPSG